MERTKTPVENLISSLQGALDFLIEHPLLTSPDVSLGENDLILMTWDRGEHHLEFEIERSEKPELFYRNRKTGEILGVVWVKNEPIREEFLSRVRLFEVGRGLNYET